MYCTLQKLQFFFTSEYTKYNMYLKNIQLKYRPSLLGQRKREIPDKKKKKTLE